MPVKVYELATEFKMTNAEMLSALRELGHTGLSFASDLEDATAARIRTQLANGKGNGAAPAAASASARPAAPAAAATPTGGKGGGAPAAPARPAAPAPAGGGEPVDVPANITIKDLAEKFGVPAAEVQKVLMGMGVLAALNQRLAADAINRIAAKMGRTVRIQAGAPAAPAAPAPAPNGNGGAPAAGARPNGGGTVAPARPGANGGAPAAGPAARPAGGAKQLTKQKNPGAGDQVLLPRPPVVTIMGHVDHGKTTLLDALRKANVAGGEAGGITQHIGAYQVETNGQRITFLDTPGHAAFSAMRNRGAKVTDIVVIVVAADDSIMPQTEEAIRIARDAEVPIIVAVNKIDLPGADPDRVLTDLTRYEIVPEAFGGDVQTVNISAKNGTGLQELIDNILLVSEAVVEPRADPHAPVSGTVLEAKIEKGRGVAVTLLVQQGTLRAGDTIVAGGAYGKVRTMGDERGNKLVKAGPSAPVEVTGLNVVPEAGDRFDIVKDEKEARVLVADRDQRLRDAKMDERNLVSLSQLYKQLRQGPVKELNVVIKGDVQGSVQAVRDSLVDLGNEEVRVRILTTGVGPISESDVLLASSDKDAEEKNSLVIGFNVGLAGGVDKKAEQEHVQIKTYSIIYELIDAVKDAMVALLPPIFEEVTLGRAEVRQLFRLPGGRSIAGSYIQDGLVRRNAKARLFRGKDLVFTGDIDTLRRFKDDAREVAAGYECGITLRDHNDVQIGDIVECFEMRQIPREL